MVEKYAEYRIRLAWGEPGEGAYHPVLKFLPLDHFEAPPEIAVDSGQSIYKQALNETHFAESAMSYTRPMRDRYEDYLINEFEPLANFEIRDFGLFRKLALPRLKRPATSDEVKKNLARRVGDELEYSRGILLRVISSEEKGSYETEFAALESTFGFILKNGIACLVMPITGAEDILDRVVPLQKEHELLAENIFVWADGPAAGFVLEACRRSPHIFKGVLLTDPEEIPAAPEFVGLPWLTVHLSEKRLMNEKGLADLLMWVKMGRISEFHYPSRLGGLLRVKDIAPTALQMPSFFVASLLECSHFIQSAGDKWAKPKLFSGTPSSETEPELDPSTFDSSLKEDTVEKKPFNLQQVEEILEMSENESDLKPMVFEEATFDCEIVRGYRELHSNNSKLSQISNRDLVKVLGLAFEKMGGGVMEQIREKDPHFHRFYLSLKALEDSPSPLY